MKRIVSSILSAIFVVASVVLPFGKGAIAKRTDPALSSKGKQLILKHNKDLSQKTLLAWSWQSDAESGRNHWSHYSHSSHSSHSSHYSHYSHYSG